MDFENMKIGCPWVSSEQIYCMIKDGSLNRECCESGCAPYHWICELSSVLWIHTDIQLKTSY
jgi:hypothetical protein